MERMTLSNTAGLRDFRDIANTMGISLACAQRAYYEGIRKLRLMDLEPALQLAAQLESQRQDDFRRGNVIRESQEEVSEWAYL